jgi:hypothetical protein
MSYTRTHIKYKIKDYIEGIGHVIFRQVTTKKDIDNSFYCVVDFPVPETFYESQYFNKRNMALHNAKTVCDALNTVEEIKRHKKGKKK